MITRHGGFPARYAYPTTERYEYLAGTWVPSATALGTHVVLYSMLPTPDDGRNRNPGEWNPIVMAWPRRIGPRLHAILSGALGAEPFRQFRGEELDDHVASE